MNSKKRINQAFARLSHSISQARLSLLYCHTRLHLGFSAKLRIWQVPACKMEPQHCIIVMKPPTHPPATHPPTRNLQPIFFKHLGVEGVFGVSGECLESVWIVSLVSGVSFESVWRMSWKCLYGCLVSNWKVFGGCMKRVPGKIYLP